MRRFIRLSDGTELDITMCGEADGVLWIHAVTDIYTAIQAFDDPARLGLIIDLTVQDGEELRRVEWEGYTALNGISTHGDEVFVSLKKGAETA
jgi:hypothetical protein